VIAPSLCARTPWLNKPYRLLFIACLVFDRGRVAVLELLFCQIQFDKQVLGKVHCSCCGMKPVLDVSALGLLLPSFALRCSTAS
jgi:hypothetical protein